MSIEVKVKSFHYCIIHIIRNNTHTTKMTLVWTRRKKNSLWSSLKFTFVTELTNNVI